MKVNSYVSPVVVVSMVIVKYVSILFPQMPENSYEFVNATVGGAIPKEYIPAIDKGIQQAMQSGIYRRLSRTGR